MIYKVVAVTLTRWFPQPVPEQDIYESVFRVTNMWEFVVHIQPDDKRENDTRIVESTHVSNNLIIIDYHQLFIFILG